MAVRRTSDAVPLLVTEQRGRVVHATSDLAKLLGYSKKQLCAMELPELLPPPFAQLHKTWIQVGPGAGAAVHWELPGCPPGMLLALQSAPVDVQPARPALTRLRQPCAAPHLLQDMTGKVPPASCRAGRVVQVRRPPCTHRSRCFNHRRPRRAAPPPSPSPAPPLASPADGQRLGRPRAGQAGHQRQGGGRGAALRGARGQGQQGGRLRRPRSQAARQPPGCVGGADHVERA
jgi:hypothetical protein